MPRLVWLGAEAPSQTTAKTSLKDNKRLLVLAVGAVVLMLIPGLAFNGLINSSSMQKKSTASRDKKGLAKSNTGSGLPNAASVAPILDAGHAPAQNTDADRVTAELVGQPAKKQPKPAMPTTLSGMKPSSESFPGVGFSLVSLAIPGLRKPGVIQKRIAAERYVANRCTFG